MAVADLLHVAVDDGVIEWPRIDGVHRVQAQANVTGDLQAADVARTFDRVGAAADAEGRPPTARNDRERDLAVWLAYQLSSVGREHQQRRPDRLVKRGRGLCRRPQLWNGRQDRDGLPSSDAPGRLAAGELASPRTSV